MTAARRAPLPFGYPPQVGSPDELAAPLKRLHLASPGCAYPVLIEPVERED